MTLSDDQDIEFGDIYGPDLFRRDHTAEELRQLALLDPCLKRFEDLMILAWKFDGHTSNIAEIQTDRGIDWHSMIRRADRIRERYRSGGLARVFARYMHLVSPEKVNRWRSIVLCTPNARALLAGYLQNRVQLQITRARLAHLRRERKKIARAIGSFK